MWRASLGLSWPGLIASGAVLCFLSGPALAGDVAEARPASLASSTGDAVEIIRSVVNEAIEEKHLQAVLLGVRVGNEDVARLAFGESMSGVPATPDMQVRNGAIAIAYLGHLLLQLVDRGVVGLDDPISTWVPELPSAEQVTLRMLINCTSGYPDYVPYQAFMEAFYADVFRTWTPEDLITIAFEQPPEFAPGQGWSYAHTNFVILGRVLERATGETLAWLMNRFVLGPLQLWNTTTSDTPSIPEPVLHAYTAERSAFYGFEREIYEDSTFWNPSWTLARGAVMTTNLADVLTSAQAIGTGAGLSDGAFSQMLAPDTSGFKPWNPSRYFGLGVIVANGWILQTPLFHGYAGVMAYLPQQQISVAIFNTRSQEAEVDDENVSFSIFKRLTELFTPDHVVR